MVGNHALKQYRTERKITQTALAKELGVSAVTVSRWETGARQIDAPLVPVIAEKLKIPARELRPDWAELMEARQ